MAGPGWIAPIVPGRSERRVWVDHSVTANGSRWTPNDPSGLRHVSPCSTTSLDSPTR